MTLPSTNSSSIEQVKDLQRPMPARRMLSAAASLFTFIFLLLSSFADMTAQHDAGTNETFLLRYNLKKGDSVTYRVISLDSLVIYNSERPRILLRERVERITYRCDTVLPDGYGMSMRLDDVIVREQLDTLPWVTKDEHPWIDRPIYFTMGFDGKRLRLRDTNIFPGSMAGAPFQPMILPHLGNIDSVSPGAGVTFERKMWMLDNVYPPIEWTGAVLRKILGTADTLNHQTLVVQLSETGQTWYMPNGPDNGVQTHIRLNGGGHYYLDQKTNLPVVGDYDLIANLRFLMGEDERQGRELIGCYFMIDELTTDLHETFETEETE